jgi:hypothetical protein
MVKWTPEALKALMEKLPTRFKNLVKHCNMFLFPKNHVRSFLRNDYLGKDNFSIQ